jgi:hypothetical protein
MNLETLALANRLKNQIDEITNDIDQAEALACGGLREKPVLIGDAELTDRSYMSGAEKCDLRKIVVQFLTDKRDRLAKDLEDLV